MRERKLRIREGFIERNGKCNCPKGEACPRPNGSACKRRMGRIL